VFDKLYKCCPKHFSVYGEFSDRSSSEVTVILARLIKRFPKNPHISDLAKIRPVGAELLHTDGNTGAGRTDGHEETNICFSQFCE